MDLSSDDDGHSASDNARNADASTSRPTALIEYANKRPRIGRIAIVVMTLAIAAALGSVVGALAGSALTRPADAPPTASEAGDMKQALAQLSAEVASLKAALEAAGKNANAQFARLGERVDRADKAQSESSARVTKLSESIDRLDRKTVAASDVTGSVVTKQEDRPPIVEGWVLREIEDGRALVQSRLGYFEVGPGSNLPGIGRVETIKRQDGRWVVVTPKGLIVSASARR